MTPTARVLFCLAVWGGSIAPALAEDNAKDFKDEGKQLRILNFSNTLGDQLAAVEGKEDKRIQTKQPITPEQLEMICSWPWITKLFITIQEDVASLEPLSKLSNLQELTLKYFGSASGQPLDAAPLGKLAKLEDLNLLSMPLKNLETLTNLKQLKRLSMPQSNADTLEFLTSTPQVEFLDLSGSQHTFTSYAPIATLKHLEFLSLHRNRQANDDTLQALSPLESLTYFSIEDCPEVTHLDFLANCKGLEKLDVDGADKLADIDALAGMANLEVISMRETPVASLAALEGLKELKNLNLQETEVSDLSPLSGCQNLDFLHLAETKVTDLGPLAHCTALRVLAIEDTEVNDLSPLQDLPELRAVSLSEGFPPEQLSVLEDKDRKIRIRFR